MEKSVFVIDDDEKLNELLRDYLAKFGFKVKTFTHPEDGLEMIEREAPDIIILDIRLKRGSGIEVLRGIRTSSYQPIVIVFTHYPGLVFRKKKLLDGVRFLFDKATGFENMLDTLKKLVHNDTSRRLAIG